MVILVLLWTESVQRIRAERTQHWGEIMLNFCVDLSQKLVSQYISKGTAWERNKAEVQLDEPDHSGRCMLKNPSECPAHFRVFLANYFFLSLYEGLQIL